MRRMRQILVEDDIENDNIWRNNWPEGMRKIQEDNN